MRLIILGAPGAGKGTQSRFLCEKYGIVQISTGDMLRSAIASGSAVGREAKQVIDAGKLVSDSIIIELVKQRLAKNDTARGFLLDGFPRTVPQANALRDLDFKLNAVVEIHVPHDEIVRRISGRRIHEASGRTYHVDFNPPKVAGVDDISGEQLIQRVDDSETTVRKRLQVYQEQTAPLIDYYSKWSTSGDPAAPKYIAVQGKGDVEAISHSIAEALDSA